MRSSIVSVAVLGVACGPSSPAGTATPDSGTASILSIDGCAAGGGNIVGAGATAGPGDPGPGYPIEAGCPGSRTLLGNIGSRTDGGLAICCRLPPSLGFAECRAAGGNTLLDPGDGSRYVLGCPDSGELLGWLVGCDSGAGCGEGGICCAPK